EGFELLFLAAPEGDGLGLLVQLDLSLDSLEVVALGDFLGSLVDGVVQLLPVHFGRDVKRRHWIQSLEKVRFYGEFPSDSIQTQSTKDNAKSAHGLMVVTRLP